MNRPPVRSWLYAPGNNQKLLDRVLTAGADAAVFDLEDAVPATEKVKARDLVSSAVAARSGQSGPHIFVRINHPASGLAAMDILAAVKPGLTGLRVPKVEDAATVLWVCDQVGRAEAATGMPPGSVGLLLSIESALGIWRADAIAGADTRVIGLNFGAVDFGLDTGISTDSADGRETLYARSRLVLASRVAGVAAPVDGVYTKIDDLEGLEREASAARAMGYFGKSAIHPRQIEPINRVFTPTDQEILRAREILGAATAAEREGRGAIRLPDGDFVDLPVVARAEALITLAKSIGKSDF